MNAKDGKAYDTKHYDLEAILAVGYRVRSERGTQFRKWATERLREYLIKGFTMDDERLKQDGGRVRYFEELLQRIRDIRSSERMFYQKVTDIYATSIDYKVDVKETKNSLPRFKIKYTMLFMVTLQRKSSQSVLMLENRLWVQLVSKAITSQKWILILPKTICPDCTFSVRVF